MPSTGAATKTTVLDDGLRAHVAANLARFGVARSAPADGRAAAVALTLVEVGYGAGVAGLPEHDQWSREPSLILTRRAAGMRNHPGQWALPGGRLDPGESPQQAALRELAEELGIARSAHHVLGCLDDFATRSGFTITPVVVWGGRAPELVLNPAEVASAHRIRLRELMREDAPMLSREEGVPGEVLRMPIGNSWIAAPTAALLYQFREVCLRGRNTRVAHFEQPRFAWR